MHAAHAICWLWIGPILKSRPACNDIYANNQSVFVKLKKKLKGLKQKLSSAVVIGACGAVTAYDFLNPSISGVAVTPLDLTSRRVQFLATP